MFYNIFTIVLVELIGVFILALSIGYVYYKYVIFNFWRKKGVFYIEPVVPTGNVSALTTGKKQVGEFFHDAYMKHKDHRVIGMYIFFKPNLVITDLDLVRTVLTEEFESFHDRGIYCNEKIDPLSNNLTFMPGKKWRHMRGKITSIFTSKKIKEMFPILKECAEELTKYLETKTEMRDCVEMKDMIARYTIDVIMSATLGIKSNCIKEPNNDYRMKARKMFVMNPIWLALAMFAPQIMEFFSIPFMDRHITKFYMSMFRDCVEYRKSHNSVRHDFLNLLIQLMENGYAEPDDDKNAIISSTIKKLTLEEAAAQSYIFFVGGFDTSSLSVTFALYELAQHQDIQDKVHNEINEILAKYDDLTYDGVNEMTYLHKVINEAMRKYPVIPYLNRICTKEIDLPTTNIHLPKGTLITIPVLGIHRDPSIYPDPDKFDPERFNAEEIAKRHPYAYLPFGEGPRSCVGLRFGYMQMKVGLAYLLSKYKFKLHPRTPIPPIFTKKAPALAAKGGLHFIIEPR